MLSVTSIRRCACGGRAVRVAKAAARNYSASFAVRGAADAESRVSEMSRLEELRESLKHGPQLGEFAGAPSRPISSKRIGDAGESGMKKPPWLRIAAPTGKARENYETLSSTVKSRNLATVCEEAQCPNIGECWGGKEGTATATIMIMGDTCTRGCSFCAVATSPAPPPLDEREPEQVAAALEEWGLGYVVLTSVDRDDLEDQGSNHFAATVRAIKKRNPSLLVECLTPDFQGQEPLVTRVATSGLDVFAHNLETVESLQARVRDRRAGYRQSLSVLEMAKKAAGHKGVLTKTSVMLGVGEEEHEVRQLLHDCRDAGVDVVTFGQYLRPSKRHLPVREFVHPDVFDMWKKEGEDMGFLYVASGPLVRSSYKAGEFFLEGEIRRRQGLASPAIPKSH